MPYHRASKEREVKAHIAFFFFFFFFSLLLFLLLRFGLEKSIDAVKTSIRVGGVGSSIETENCDFDLSFLLICNSAVTLTYFIMETQTDDPQSQMESGGSNPPRRSLGIPRSRFLYDHRKMGV